MFICDDCLEKNYTNTPSFSVSFGPCEDCGHNVKCNDIPCARLQLKPKPGKKKAKGRR